jgi:general secretion pathway protein C
MLKRYFWLAHMLLVTLAAILGADIATSYISAKLTIPVSSKPIQTRNTPDRQTREAFANYQVIATRNIFNATPPQKGQGPVEPQPPVPQATTPTQLQLKLAGTVAGANNQYYAIIEDISQRGAQAVYQIGDAIQNVLIVDIRPECVTLDQNGTYESLCFENDTGDAKVARRQPPPAPSQDVDDSGIVRVDAATWRVGRELILEQFGDLGRLSTQARVMPYIVQGQPQGFRVTRLKRNSLLQKIGLQNGDIIQKVNGSSITSPGDALRGLQQLHNASTVRLEILRRKRSTTLTYELR